MSIRGKIFRFLLKNQGQWVFIREKNDKKIQKFGQIPIADTEIQCHVDRKTVEHFIPVIYTWIPKYQIPVDFYELHQIIK